MTDFFSPENEIYARYAARGLFALCTIILVTVEIRKHKFSKEDFFKNNTLPAASFFILLAAAIFSTSIGIAATTVFTATTIIHFALNRKVYPLHKIFYFLFLYALLRVFGTIGTPQGFRFPDTILTFFVLPLSLCLININQETLLKIAKVFTRVMIAYMIICIVYWLYNFQYLDIPISEWLTQKSSTIILPNDFEKGDARFFVTFWSGYFHPTYISFVWFMGLIASVYLFFKQKISSFEPLLYGFLCATAILLTESRIGIVTFPIVSVLSLLLYSVLRKKHITPVLLSAIIIGATIIFLISGNIEKDNNMMRDHRSTYYPIAINYIKNNPYWGCGYNEQRAALDEQIAFDSIAFCNASPDSASPDIINITKRLHFSHNQFLGDTVQFGIWGLIILLTLLSAILFYTIKWQSYPLLIFLIVLSLYMMIEEPLYIQGGITRVTIFFVFFIALTAKPTAQINNNEKKH